MEYRQYNSLYYPLCLFIITVILTLKFKNEYICLDHKTIRTS